ncbi:hypothetical protein BU15DRAFT_63353 [Melanogaster broomeanus]|nr:hypothetical protein BU15DRAFT_63353 [Melanogaster broomeanus]
MAASFQRPDLRSASIGMVISMSVSGVMLILDCPVPKLVRRHRIVAITDRATIVLRVPMEGSFLSHLPPWLLDSGKSLPASQSDPTVINILSLVNTRWECWFSSRELRFIVSHCYPSCCGLHGERASQSMPGKEIPGEYCCTVALSVKCTLRQCAPSYGLLHKKHTNALMETLSSASQGSQDKADSGSIFTALWNAWDLLVNVRGVGWNWSRGLIVPKPVFEIRSRTVFVLLSAVRFAFHVSAFEATLHLIRMISPENFSSVTAMLGVAVFQQHPSQWPPLFDSPWSSTSLSDLWSRRWHQTFRHTFLAVGGRPFNFLFGRLGGVLGVFLVSGLWHDLQIRAVGRGNFLIVVGFFTMNGVGVVLERVWKRWINGPRVDGLLLSVVLFLLCSNNYRCWSRWFDGTSSRISTWWLSAVVISRHHLHARVHRPEGYFVTIQLVWLAWFSPELLSFPLGNCE